MMAICKGVLLQYTSAVYLHTPTFSCCVVSAHCAFALNVCGGGSESSGWGGCTLLEFIRSELGSCCASSSVIVRFTSAALGFNNFINGTEPSLRMIQMVCLQCSQGLHSHLLCNIY